MTDEITRMRMFDEHCAKVMELVRGVPYGSNESYFTKDGTYICRVDDYNPYNDIEVMEPVIDSLVSALGLHLDSGLMQRAGLLVAARELIWNNMVLDDMIGDSEVNTKIDEQLEFNNFCASVISLEIEERYESYEDSTGEHVRTLLFAKSSNSLPTLYDPYNDVKLLGIVVTYLYGFNNPKCEPFDPDDWAGSDVFSILASWRNYVAGQMASANPWSWPIVHKGNPNPEDILDVEEGWDRFDRIFKEVVHPMYDNDIVKHEPTDVGNPRDIDWQAANILVRAGYNDATSFSIEDPGGRYYLLPRTNDPRGIPNCIMPFSYTEEGYLQFAAIERYLRDPSNCLELWEGIEDRMHFSPVIGLTEGAELAYVHRQAILKQCLRAMTGDYKTEEELFNELCFRIIQTYETNGYCIDASFNPYQDIAQLSRIVQIILEVSGQPLSINAGADVDMADEMMDYINAYSTEQYYPELYVVEK